MKEKFKNQKGITLIALIITIIVLLILAAVSINIIKNQGLITKSIESTNKYKQKAEEEQKELLKSEYEMAKYEGSFTGTYTDYVLEKKYGVKIGDYVDYNYDTVSDGYTLEKEYSGYPSDQKVTQSTGLKWRVLGVDKKENIELICEKVATNESVHFNGATGYNNGVYLLNDMCKKLYSNSQLEITARSLNIEDIEDLFSDKGKNERDSFIYGNVAYGQTESYLANNKYPLIYAEEAGSGVNGIIREGGIGRSDPFYTKKIDLSIGYDAEGKVLKTYTTASGNLYTTQTKYSCYLKSSNFKNEIFYKMICYTGTNYWLASRCVSCVSSAALFGLNYVEVAGLYDECMFYSYGGTNGGYHYIRPVVSLTSNIAVDTSTGDGTVNSMYSLKVIK